MRAFDFLIEREILLMGGHAFKNLNLGKIKREDIDATLKYVANKISFPGLDYNYMKNNMMGSAGKQAESGDLDIAVDKKQFYLYDIHDRIKEVLPLTHINSKSLKGGQIQTVWPIAGNEENGFVQIDFIEGNPEWLKFTHHSPGLDVSSYKGVWISTLLGILAKMKKDFEIYDKNEERLAKVGLHYNLEKGLHRQWKIQKKPGQGLSKIDPWEWETAIGKMMDKGIIPTGKIPSFSKIGYVDEPEAAIQMLFGNGVTQKDINTFEKAWHIVEQNFPNEIEEIKDRLADALQRSGLKNTMSKEEIIRKVENL